MRRAKLDKIDRKILRDLQENGRITNVELAKNVGISAPPCLRRVRALEESGFIKSYHAKVDSAVLGYTVTVYAMVTLSTQVESIVEGFEEFVMNEPMIRECSLLAGDVDFMLKIVAKDWDAYQKFHKDHLSKAPGVSSVKSSLSIRMAKEEMGVPVEDV